VSKSTRVISILLMLFSSLMVTSGLIIVEIIPLSGNISRLYLDHLSDFFLMTSSHSILYGSAVFIGSVLIFSAINLGRHIIIGTAIFHLLFKIIMIIPVIIAKYPLGTIFNKAVSLETMLIVFIIWYLLKPSVRQWFIQEEIARSSDVIDILIEESRKINPKIIFYGVIFLFFGLSYLISLKVTPSKVLAIIISVIPQSFIPIPKIQPYLLDGILLSLLGILILLRRLWHLAILIMIFFVYNAATLLGLGLAMILRSKSFDIARDAVFIMPFIITMVSLEFLTSIHSRIQFKRYKYKKTKEAPSQ